MGIDFLLEDVNRWVGNKVRVGIAGAFGVWEKMIIEEEWLTLC